MERERGKKGGKKENAVEKKGRKKQKRVGKKKECPCRESQPGSIKMRETS